jgi:hypothetical protein
VFGNAPICQRQWQSDRTWLYVRFQPVKQCYKIHCERAIMNRIWTACQILLGGEKSLLDIPQALLLNCIQDLRWIYNYLMPL